MRTLRSILLAMALATTGAAAARPHIDTAHVVAMREEVRHAGELVFDAIGGRRVVLIGEMHGTEEAPALVGALLDRQAMQRRPLVLGLEMGAREQSRLDRYLGSHGTAEDRRALLGGAHWQWPHDGGDSRAMFELIEHARRLRAGGARIDLIAFDDPSDDMDTRNRRMAETLRQAVARTPNATLLVLTGNVHAMTRRPQGDMFNDGKRIDPPVTMGRDLAELAPLSIDVEGLSGAFWACWSPGRCAEQAVMTHAPASLVPTQARLERNAPDAAWDDTLWLPRFTSSPPAIAQDAAATRARSP